MTGRSLLFALLATTVGLSDLYGSEATFRFIPSWPTDMSANGEILIRSTSLYSPRYSYLFGQVEVLSQFDAFGSATVAMAISEDGNIVAGHGSSPGSHHYRAWIKRRGEGFQRLGTLGGDRSLVGDMSADGTVIVGNSTDDNQELRGFRWSADTGMVPIESLPGATSSGVYEISGDGRVILGGSRFACPTCDPGFVTYDCAGFCSPPVPTYTESFIWTESTGAVSIGRLVEPGTERSPLGHLPLPQSIRATALSDDGNTVVGRTISPNGSFIWNVDTGMEYLPKLSGHWHSFYPLDISADGRTVVGHVAGVGAVIWTPERGTQLLETILNQEFGLDNQISNIHLEQATLISADGRTIAGHSGDDRWWVVTLPHALSVPEPSLFLLVIGGIAGMSINLRMQRPLCREG